MALLLCKKHDCVDALRTNQCFNMPGKEVVNVHIDRFLCYLVHKWLTFFSFYFIKCLYLNLPCVCVDCLELFYVKYFFGEKKNRSNHLKTNLSVDLLKRLNCWKIGSRWRYFSCITKVLNLCAASPLWGLCVSIWDRKWPCWPFVRQQSFSQWLATQLNISFFLFWVKTKDYVCRGIPLRLSVFSQSHLLKSEWISLDICWYFLSPLLQNIAQKWCSKC